MLLAVHMVAVAVVAATDVSLPAAAADGGVAAAHNDAVAVGMQAHKVSVPGGPFAMGCAADERDCGVDNRPRRQVTVSAFDIDREPVGQRAYQQCVAAKACPVLSLPPLDEVVDWPMQSATYLAADSYCRWVGKRLPTEAEWEKAARGLDGEGRLYPWGNEPNGPCPDNSGRSRSDARCADSASPYGVLGMGADLEWVLDWYSRSPPSGADPSGPLSGVHRVYRGRLLGKRGYEQPEAHGMYRFAFRCVSGGATLQLGRGRPAQATGSTEAPTETDWAQWRSARQANKNKLVFALGVASLASIPLAAFAADRRGVPCRLGQQTWLRLSSYRSPSPQ